jgi:heme oxygenase
LGDSTLTLPDRLKAATADLHVALEERLGLGSPPYGRERFEILLERFHGFHAVWEPAVAALIGDAALLEPRRRLHLIEQDLQALGARPTNIARCSEAGALSAFEAWGSLYVMEGSTLGGRIIAKRMSDEIWLPPGGLRYFDPYGPETGSYWKVLRERLQAISSPTSDEAIVIGARLTFERLTRWLEPGFRL